MRGGVQRSAATLENVNVAGIAMAIPIFDRNQGNISEARVRVMKARDEQTATDVRLQSDLSQAHQTTDCGIARGRRYSERKFFLAPKAPLMPLPVVSSLASSTS